jgi:hypothetical protein
MFAVVAREETCHHKKNTRLDDERRHSITPHKPFAWME